jgi:hypothetical protein
MLHVDINLPRGVVKRDLVEASEKGGESDEYLRTSQTTISPSGFLLFGCSERGNLFCILHSGALARTS